MKISDYNFEQHRAPLPKLKKELSLADFLNYAKKQGYFVDESNIQHWINEYQEFLKLN